MSWNEIKSKCKRINNQDDKDYATGCMKKLRYECPAQASVACNVMNKRYKKVFNTYECRFCGGWHVGGLNNYEC